MVSYRQGTPWCVVAPPAGNRWVGGWWQAPPSVSCTAAGGRVWRPSGPPSSETSCPGPQWHGRTSPPGPRCAEAGTGPPPPRTRWPVHQSKMVAASGEPCGRLAGVAEGTVAVLTWRNCPLNCWCCRRRSRMGWDLLGNSYPGNARVFCV